jgi:hypothetical protein
MKFKATKYDVKVSLKGVAEITLTAAPEHSHILRQILNEKDLQGELTIEIKKFSKPRSKDQNSMLYAIEEKLAEALNLSAQEVHKKNILDYGVKLGEAIMLSNLAHNWCKSNYGKVISEKVEKGKAVAKIELYAGSSELNTKEFKTLLDGVLQECENVGVNVEYESKELKSLLEEK